VVRDLEGISNSSKSSILQATIAPPIKGKMFKGLCMCYAVIVSTYFSVGISGYWSFGNRAQPTILANFMGNRQPLLPRWFLLLTNIFTLMQVTAIALVSPIPYHL